jgi:hypothetical protein
VFGVVAGHKKSSQEKENDYQRNLRNMKTMLLSYREELEMVKLNGDVPKIFSGQIFIVHDMIKKQSTNWLELLTRTLIWKPRFCMRKQTEEGLS